MDYLLWHATITPGQCSFASMASTEEGFAAGAAAGAAGAGPGSGGSAGVSGGMRAISPEQSPMGSFLDLTSGIARFAMQSALSSVGGGRGRALHGVTEHVKKVGPARCWGPATSSTLNPRGSSLKRHSIYVSACNICQALEEGGLGPSHRWLHVGNAGRRHGG